MKIITAKKLWPSRLGVGLVSCLFSVFTVNSALAAPVNIADVPPFLGASVEPNILFIIDDSGSMQFEMIPDNLAIATRYTFPPVSNMYGGGIYSSYIHTFDDDNPYNLVARSNDGNPLFYDPDKDYEPWFRGNRSQWDDADPEGAWYNPGRTASGMIDLTGQQTHDRWIDANESGAWHDTGDRNFWPITFYVKMGTGDDGVPSSYVRYQYRNNVMYSKVLPDGSEVQVNQLNWGNGKTRTVSEELQNFANWFSYYRSRTLASRAGIGNAFSQQPEGLRVGYGRLNKGSSSVDGVSTTVIENGVRLFKGSDRENFFTNLYTDDVPVAGTPLRNALYRAGKYFERTDDQGPWGAEPGTNNTADHLECRQSYTILMTDGYYGGSMDEVGNADGSDGEQIGDFKYEPVSPFKDEFSNTLADVAMHFWKRDLRTDLANDVPVSGINPAFWQHMVTFGIGLGVSGSIDPDDAFGAIGSDTVLEWPNPGESNSAKIDDLLHASVNSRGGFFSAADPETFAKELSDVLSLIISRVEESSTSAAASSAVLRKDALSFSAGFRSTDWSGALQAAEILKGGARGNLIWDAEYGLEAKGAAGRKLFTNNGSGGVVLSSLGALSETQQSALNTALDGTTDGLGQDRIDWLRGDNSANPRFRDRLFQPEGDASPRLRLLGDIIGSNPQFAGKTNFGHRRLPDPEGSSYAVFRSSSDYQSRDDVIYVGANDGFLHGFHSLTGEELFAYMPGELLSSNGDDPFAQVNELMEPQYNHRYYVDGTPTVGDAYIGGAWRTILVGTMGAGGRTVFALDVTDPENFDASDVLWEFTDPELGRGVESPQIVRLPSGEWAAVFGNGYNTQSNESALFVVDVSDGSLISKVMTGEGSDATPNGMSVPVVLTDSTTGIAKAAYAGDLRGHLWRVDLSSYKGTLLFTAARSDGTRQPITAAPQLASNPDGEAGDLVVVFGTGSYFRVGDSSATQVQSLYGIFDDGSASRVTRKNLLEQDIAIQKTVNYNVTVDGVTTSVPADIRVLTNNALGTNDEGWLVDLDRDIGERVVSKPSFPSGFPVKRVRFSTLIPDPNACSGGRDGYLMDIDLTTGGKTANHVFDLNRDGKFDAGDAADSNIVNGIKGITSGEELRVVLDGTTDLVVESVIEDLPENYKPPKEPGPDDPEDEGSSDYHDGDDGEPPCEGPLCGDAEGYNFGRQYWEELR